MSIEHVIDLLVCPYCGGQLSLDEQHVGCPSGHAFDLARQGYLNLYARAAPKNADTVAMIAARARFLEAGHYAEIDRALVEAGMIEAAGRGAPAGARVLDCGAGTGHYLARVLDSLPASRGIALDVSVAAARRAVRAHEHLGAVVADAWRRLPVRTAALDVVLSIFAPRNPPEFARVLAPGGVLVSVHPTQRHLAELRERLPMIKVEADKTERLAATLGEYFARQQRGRVEFTARWRAETVRDVVAMGPNAFHLDHDQLARANESPLDVTVSVDVTSWVRLG
jgi:23S rRNA (guanine745-N1)-methyltransferase